MAQLTYDDQNERNRVIATAVRELIVMVLWFGSLLGLTVLGYGWLAG